MQNNEQDWKARAKAYVDKWNIEHGFEIGQIPPETAFDGFEEWQAYMHFAERAGMKVD